MNLDSQTVTLSSGADLEYDGLIITTGARCRTLPGPRARRSARGLPTRGAGVLRVMAGVLLAVGVKFIPALAAHDVPRGAPTCVALLAYDLVAH